MSRPRKSVADKNTAIDYLNRDIVNIKTDIAILNKLVRDGNGQPSLLQQVATVRTEISNFESEMREAVHDIKQSMENHHIETLMHNKMSWQFKASLVVAIITSLTSILIHFYK